MTYPFIEGYEEFEGIKTTFYNTLNFGTNSGNLFFYTVVKKSAAELTFIRENEFKDMWDDLLQGEDNMPTAEYYLLFNRIIVQAKNRRKREGTALLKTLCEWCDNHDAIIINGVNAYGTMDQRQVIKWIENYGFKYVYGNVYIRKPFTGQ